MKGYELGRAIETAEAGVIPSFASFFWKARTSAASCLYDTVKALLPGTMMAVSLDEWEKALARVVILNWPYLRNYSNRQTELLKDKETLREDKISRETIMTCRGHGKGMM